MNAVDVAEFERALERHDLTAQVWGEDDDEVETLGPDDDVRVTVWDGEAIMHECVVRRAVLSDTLDFIAILMDGGALE